MNICEYVHMTKPDACDVLFINEPGVRAVRKKMLAGVTASALAATFKALGDSTRLRILHALSIRELCVCDLSSLLGMRQSAVSHQLRILRDLKMVKFRKEGKIAHYSLSDLHVLKLLAQGLAHAKE